MSICKNADWCVDDCNGCACHSDEVTVEVEEVFKKDDKMKPRYDLLPKSASLLIDAESDLFQAYYESMTSPSNAAKIATLTRLLKRVQDSCTLADIATVSAYGADRYGEGNWKLAKSTGRYWAALGRHISSMGDAGCEDVDLDSGIPHAAHASVNILFLLDFITEETCK